MSPSEIVEKFVTQRSREEMKKVESHFAAPRALYYGPFFRISLQADQSSPLNIPFFSFPRF